MNDWCILVQSTHHQRGEGDAGGDLQGVGGDQLVYSSIEYSPPER